MKLRASRSVTGWLIGLLILVGRPIAAQSLVVEVGDGAAGLADAAVLVFPADVETDGTNTAGVLRQVEQRGQEFRPGAIIIQQGDQVSFPNLDRTRHHIYSFSEARPFEIELYSGTPAEPIRFDRPGVVTLGCNIHDWMYGIIYVSPTPHAALTDARGMAHLELPAPGRYEVEIWHPRARRQGERFTVTADADVQAPIRLSPQLRAAIARPARPAAPPPPPPGR